MAAADTPVRAQSTRSKRTRQSAPNDDSVKQPLQKKRRSALRRDTFEPLTEASINEVAGRDLIPEKQNGHVTGWDKQHARASSQTHELTLRGVSKTDKRSNGNAGQFILSNNDFYTVAQLPCLPEQIRSHPSMPYSCVISPEYDYVLALTHHDAYIWPYSSTHTVPSSRDLIYFKLPFPSSSVDDPLPLAAFTARSANAEPGIVAVSPRWGKVAYWENISSASSFVQGQKSTAVQGSVPGLMSNELIQELVRAEPAGFVMTFNHGRVAHLTLRDQMGRPGIGVQFLRKSSSGTSRAGIFGSIRNVFGGDRRRGTPMARAAGSAKAQRDIVIGTEDGEFEFWSANLSVGNSLVKMVTVKEELHHALQTRLAQDSTPLIAKIHDFEVMSTPSKESDVARTAGSASTRLILLISTVGLRQPYHLVETVLFEDEVSIKAIHTLKGFQHMTIDLNSRHWRPRLCIPSQSAAAFVLFETTVALVSLAKIRESPSSQLLMDKAHAPDRFQDCISFQEDSFYRVLGYTGECLDKHGACTFVVQGFGLVRLTFKLHDGDEIDADDLESGLSAKSKIEQAIFFGTLRQNPLDLDRPSEQQHSAEEVEAAVLEISREILSSSSKYLPKAAPSLENQIKLRAKALHDLAHHALRYYPAAVTRNTRFLLLWDAERLAAAQAIWKVQERLQRSYPRNDDREMTYLDFCLRALHESRQVYPDADKGETDRVRHWLINSVTKIEHLLSELVSCLKELDDMDVRDPRIVCDYMREALDIWIAAYQTAFKFREDHAQTYGLGDEVYSHGVLQSAYPPGIPHPWTSNEEPFIFGQRLIYDVCRFLDNWWDVNAQANGDTKNKKRLKKVPTDLNGKSYGAPARDALLDLAARLPQEVELFSHMVYEENIQAISNAKQTFTDAETLQGKVSQIKGQVRPRIASAIEAISHFNMPGAIELAEKMRDPGLLVALNTQYLVDLEVEAHNHPEDRKLIERKTDEVQRHVETYYDTIGNGWAFAHFSSLVMNGQTGTLLGEAQANHGKKQHFVSWFLGKSDKLGQQVGKVSWINDVVGEQKYDRAQKTLESVARDEETDIWAKKTEFCLAKLAGLAAAEGVTQPPLGTTPLRPELTTRYDRPLAILEIQQEVSMHIAAAVKDAIDGDAAYDLAVETFAKRVVEKKPALRRILIACVDSILQNQSLDSVSLINLLTLMDPTEFAGLAEDEPGVQSHEFALALQVLDLSIGTNLDQADLDALRMLIWIRAIVRDDWSILNDTSGKSDQEVMVEMQMSSLFRTLLDVFQRQLDHHSGSDHNDSSLKLFSPQEILDAKPSGLLTARLKDQYFQCVGADSTTPEGKRFLKQLEDELTKEHDLLRKYIDKAQVGKHWAGLVREAETMVQVWNSTNGDLVAYASPDDGIPSPAANGEILESIEVRDA